MKVNYELMKKKLQKLNVKSVEDSVLTKEKRARVRSYATRKGLSIRACEKAFRTSKEFRSLFVPDVSRQNVYEKAFYESLILTFGYGSVSKLANAGDKALYVEKGRLVKGEKSPWNLTKSVDFDLVYGGNRFVISHKYTEHEGGSQDNQLTDIKLFLQECKGWKESKTYAIAVVDGDFFKRNKRLQLLQELYQNKRVFVTTSDKLESLVKSLAKK